MSYKKVIIIKSVLKIIIITNMSSQDSHNFSDEE